MTFIIFFQLKIFIVTKFGHNQNIAGQELSWRKLQNSQLINYKHLNIH